MHPHNHEPPYSAEVLTLDETAQKTKRTKNALKILRHRRRGPDSFVQDGRLYYYRCCVDAWLSAGARADSRFNRKLDPTQDAPKPRIPTAA